jgi:D-alanyl-D-alanine carboxypeptidase
MIRPAATALMLAAMIAPAPPARGTEPAPFHAVLDSMRTERKITGAATTVILSDGSIWNGTSGEAARGVPVTAETLFEMGSITKTFTAALVLSFVADGVLALDDSLSRWMPDFPNATGVTIRQLLQHTSGLFNYSENPEYIPALRADFSRVWKPEDSFAYMQEPYFPPGEGWHYSNANYLLLGLVCEALAGEAFPALMRARVLTPQGLTHTYFLPDEATSGPMAHAFIDINNDGTPEDISMLVTMTPFITAAWSAGALVATAEDLALWMRAYCTGEVVGPELFTQVTRWVERGDGMEYGLGLIRKPHGDGYIYGHKGNSAGYSASAWHSPATGVTVALLTNGHAIDVTPIALELLDAADAAPIEE